MLAVKHAKTFDAKILLVTSLHGDSTSDLDRTQTAETNLNPAKELVIQKGIPCKSHVLVRGLTPGEDLVNFAKETDSDEIFWCEKEVKSRLIALWFKCSNNYFKCTPPCSYGQVTEAE